VRQGKPLGCTFHTPAKGGCSPAQTPLPLIPPSPMRHKLWDDRPRKAPPPSTFGHSGPSDCSPPPLARMEMGFFRVWKAVTDFPPGFSPLRHFTPLVVSCDGQGTDSLSRYGTRCLTFLRYSSRFLVRAPLTPSSFRSNRPCQDVRPQEMIVNCRVSGALSVPGGLYAYPASFYFFPPQF